MKNMIKLLLVFISSCALLLLCSCGGDSNDDSTGAPQQPESADSISLIEDGVANFRIVLGEKIPTDVRKIVDLQIVQTLERNHGIEIKAAQQGTSGDEIQDVEVLIGDVTNRGSEYIYDRYEFGEEGYAIKIVGNKVVIQAGSDAKLLWAVVKFAEDVLKINSNEISQVTMTSDDQAFYIQDDYKVTSLSVGKNDMRGYVIAADTENDYYKAAAFSIRDKIYSRTGYYLNVVKPEQAGDKAVILRRADKNAVSADESFSIKTDGTKLVISCAYDNMLEGALGEFLSQYIILASGDVSFSGDVFKKDVSFVTYEDFGAKGDGKSNDYQAFYDTHVFANECGQTVKADPDKTYLLSDPTIVMEGGNIGMTAIPIKTNVEWGKAKIIVDDSAIDYHNPDTTMMARTWVFSVQSDYPVLTMRATDSAYYPKLSALGSIGYSYGTKKIDLGLGYEAMLIIYNENHEVYRRTGSDRYDGSGQAQHEVIVIDEEGNIDDSTPFMFDYDTITKIEIYRLDIEPITISGGVITTVAPRFDTRFYIDGIDPETNNPIKIEKDAGYFARGLNIKRSFTTIDGLEHYVENEVTLAQYFEQHLQGAVYNGFFNASCANEVIIKNCVMTGRRCYNTHGTYEFSANCVNKIVLENCYQHNFWVDDQGLPSDEYTGRTSMDSVGYNGLKAEDGKTTVQFCWGVGGTNFCKNMHYIDSRISRFDAHCGLYNGSIVGCEISFFEIIGKGRFEVRDTDYYSNGSQQLVYLRGDYGCTWEGDFIIEDVRCYVAPDKQFSIFLHSFTNWYYGYKCYIPSVEIKDLAVYNTSTYDGEKFELFGADYRYLHMYTKISDRHMHLDKVASGADNNNPIGVPEYIKISSNKNEYQYRLPYDDDRDDFLAGVNFYSGETKVEYKLGNQGCFTFY